MITQATETVDYIEDEAREGIRKYLDDWPRSVDRQYRDYPPRRFRVLRVETHTRYLAIVESASFDPPSVHAEPRSVPVEPSMQDRP